MRIDDASENLVFSHYIRIKVFTERGKKSQSKIDIPYDGRNKITVLASHAYAETVSVQLPGGFDVDELPDAVKLDTPFGSYVTSYAVKDGQLRFTRSLVVRAATISVADYPKVRAFYERIRAAEQSPVVLAKK